jgi:flavin reductase (DIM6/NTAB) family NADH-FMN oxidoreductase RutF
MINFPENLNVALQNLPSGAFLTTKVDNKVNVMTIGWGTVGVYWRRPVFSIIIRDTRYTKKLLDESHEFTVSMPLDKSMADALGYCGTKCGKDVDKIKELKLKLADAKTTKTPVILCHSAVFECKNILYSQKIDLPALDSDLKNQFYANDRSGTFYYGEISDCYEIGENQ